MEFEGKIALVTGSSRGIGKATALEFARKGANLIVTCLRKKTEAQAVVNEIQKMGREAIAVKVNVADLDQIKELFSQIKEAFGRLDILINNASIAAFKSLAELTPKSLNFTLDANIAGPFWCIKEALQLMPKPGGKIVNLSSIGSQRIIKKGAADYTAAKAGLEGLTRYLAFELAPLGINVNAVAPGLVNTDSLKFLLKDPEFKKRVEFCQENIGWKIIAEPEDIAKVVVWLCSEEANWIKGQVIDASGGLTLI